MEEFKNIVALSGCMSSQLSKAILADEKKQARKLLQFYNVVFPNFYLEFMRHGHSMPDEEDEKAFSANEIKINNALWKYHKDYGIPIVVTNDSHYINEEDGIDHETLLAIQTGSNMDNPNRFRFNGSGYFFADAGEIKKKFSSRIWKQSEKSMKEIVSKANISLPEFDTDEHFIPSFGIKNPDKELRRLCIKGFKERVSKNNRREYLRQLNYQLQVIKDCGYADEFLIVNDYVNFARRSNIQTGAGRGSMVGVLVSYLMGITDIDPIRFNLSFERALNPERPSLPDFDIDFSDKDLVIDYLREKYGHENTMQIGTYSRLHYRSLLRALLRVFNYDYKISIQYSKQLPDIVDIIAEKAPSDFDQLVAEAKGDLAQLFVNDKRIVPLMKKFNGLISSMGTHAGGLLIGDENLALRELIPTYKVSSEKELISQFDKKVVEKQLGFVKFDILGITTLEIIQNCLGLIGEDIFDRFPDGDKLEDEETFKLLNTKNLTYIFQLDGYANRSAIEKIGGVNDFEDIVIVTSVSRPGTSQFIPELAHNRKHGIKKYVNKDLKPILDVTYGVLLYQEQVMEIARKFAGFSMIQVDDIKEMIKGKDHAKFEAMKPDFIKGCENNGYTDKEAEEVWKIVERASGYLYNRSHAVSYSVITYQTAYLKSHYPLEFFLACMNINKPDDVKIKSLMHEASGMDIEILGPDIYKSDVNASIEGDKIRLGFSMIKGIGVRTAAGMVLARQKDGRKGILDLPKRIMSVRCIQALKDAGALGEKHTNSELQIKVMGFALNDPINKYIDFIDKHMKEDEDEVVFGGTIVRVNRRKTKKGDDMAYVDLAYKGDTRSLVMFSDQLYDWGDMIDEGAILLVKGRKQQNYDTIIPSRMRVLNK